MTDNDAMLASWDEKIMGESAAVAGAMVRRCGVGQCPSFVRNFFVISFAFKTRLSSSHWWRHHDLTYAFNQVSESNFGFGCRDHGDG
jgi:hypothetical protein